MSFLNLQARVADVQGKYAKLLFASSLNVGWHLQKAALEVRGADDPHRLAGLIFLGSFAIRGENLFGMTVVLERFGRHEHRDFSAQFAHFSQDFL